MGVAPLRRTDPFPLRIVGLWECCYSRTRAAAHVPPLVHPAYCCCFGVAAALQPTLAPVPPRGHWGAPAALKLPRTHGSSCSPCLAAILALHPHHSQARSSVHNSAGRRDRFPSAVHHSTSTGRRDRFPSPVHHCTGRKDGFPSPCTIAQGGGTGSLPLCTTQQDGGTGSPPLCTTAQGRGMRSLPLCTTAQDKGMGSLPLRTTAQAEGQVPLPCAPQHRTEG